MRSACLVSLALAACVAQAGLGACFDSPQGSCGKEAVPLSGPRAEFNRYYREITGRDPADTLLELHVSADVSKSGNDAYVLRSTKDGVSVTGSNLRSVYYGVYDLLERRGGCHWFWDGDVVPKRDRLDFSGLDVRDVKTLDEMRPTLPRTQDNYRRTMLALAAAADAVLK